MIRRRPLIAYIVLACGISWLLWAPLWMPAFGITGLPTVPFHHALGALGPITAAFIVAGLVSGGRGVWDLIQRMGMWRGRLLWLGVALVGPFLVFVLAVATASIVTGERFALTDLGVSREFPGLSVLGFLAYNILSFGYGEEVGWRGVALPRLQSDHSAFGATLTLTLGWALWHAPLFLYRPGYANMGVAGVTGWVVSLLTGAVLLTWLYNESQGSILVVALFHATVDVVFTSDVSSAFVVNAAGALITIWGIIVLVFTGRSYLSRKGKVVCSRDPDSVTDFISRSRAGVDPPSAKNLIWK